MKREVKVKVKVNIAKQYKARIVVCGKRNNLELTNALNPVVHYSRARLLLSITVLKNCNLHQVD